MLYGRLTSVKLLAIILHDLIQLYILISLDIFLDNSHLSLGNIFIKSCRSNGLSLKRIKLDMQQC